MLHWEMKEAEGLIMSTAYRHRLPAGGALAVDRDPFAHMEDFHAAIGDAGPELEFGQGVGHRVIVFGDFDVVVETGAALFPFGVLVGLGRQGFEGRPVELLEQLAAAGAEGRGRGGRRRCIFGSGSSSCQPLSMRPWIRRARAG